MAAVEGSCDHGTQVRVTDSRDLSTATVNVWCCREPECVHAALHWVQDHTKSKIKPFVIPLPPV